jgi:hypothetical protein
VRFPTLRALHDRGYDSEGHVRPCELSSARRRMPLRVIPTVMESVESGKRTPRAAGPAAESSRVC